MKHMKELDAFLAGKRTKRAFVTTMKNGKTRFENTRYVRFCGEARQRFEAARG